MTLKIRRIEENEFDDHSFLKNGDKLFCLGDYFKNDIDSYMYSLIHNLKKPPTRRGLDEWRFKEKSINEVSSYLSKVMRVLSREKSSTFWVPIPPSKVIGDELYDDRLKQILDKASEILSQGRNHNTHIANVLFQNSSRDASHISEDRPKPQELQKLYTLMPITNFDQDKDLIILFDDVMTTGSHFKAASSKILELYPNAQIIGCFIARRAFKETEE